MQNCSCLVGCHHGTTSSIQHGISTYVGHVPPEPDLLFIKNPIKIKNASPIHHGFGGRAEHSRVTASSQSHGGRTRLGDRRSSGRRVARGLEAVEALASIPRLLPWLARSGAPARASTLGAPAAVMEATARPGPDVSVARGRTKKGAPYNT